MSARSLAAHRLGACRQAAPARQNCRLGGQRHDAHHARRRLVRSAGGALSRTDRCLGSKISAAAQDLARAAALVAASGARPIRGAMVKLGPVRWLWPRSMLEQLSHYQQSWCVVANRQRPSSHSSDKLRASGYGVARSNRGNKWGNKTDIFRLFRVLLPMKILLECGSRRPNQPLRLTLL